MSLLVFDSSAALKWFLPELHADKAKQIRDEYRKAITELIAPDIFPVETLHALTNAERQKRFNVASANLPCVSLLYYQRHGGKLVAKHDDSFEFQRPGLDRMCSLRTRSPVAL